MRRCNPYDPEGTALHIRDALVLPADERAASMGRLQESLTSIYDWMNNMFQCWGRILREGGACEQPPADPLAEPFDDELAARVNGDERY